MRRRIRLGVASLLGAIVVLGASSALALTIPNNVYTLPVQGSVATTVDLGTPYSPAFPEWRRVRPFGPLDSTVNYTVEIVRDSEHPASGSGTPGDARIFTLTFKLRWNGDIGPAPLTDAFAPQMLFAIVDSRFERGFGSGEDYASTYDLIQSGFVRDTHPLGLFRRKVGSGPWVTVTPEIIRDVTPGKGFVSNHYPHNWIGVYLPATPNVNHFIRMRWALGETPTGGDDVFFPQALFVATVPEPGTGVLVGLALLALGVARRRTA